MTERPILFTSPMVLAILAGRKGQTRRVVSPHRSDDSYVLLEQNDGSLWPYRSDDGESASVDGMEIPLTCPYGKPGGILWVKETWVRHTDGSVGFLADYPKAAAGELAPAKIKWRSSIFMPRASARLWLRVMAVRVERLQDIGETDAEGEGVAPLPGGGQIARYRRSFELLWDSINASHGRGFPWRSNPWVWVISFKRELQ